MFSYKVLFEKDSLKPVQLFGRTSLHRDREKVLQLGLQTEQLVSLLKRDQQVNITHPTHLHSNDPGPTRIYQNQKSGVNLFIFYIKSNKGQL